MIVMQYEIALPADYEMRVIRDRVATRGSSFDDFPGLGVKAFLIREKGRHGAEGNQYSPLYLWPEVEPMWRFIAGDGFKGILASFGWRPIQYWLGLAYTTAPAVKWKTLKSVTREQVSIDAEIDLAALQAREIEAAHEVAAKGADRVARAVGLNTQSWSLVRFDYWTCEQSALPRNSWSYEVLHVSAPHSADLKPT